MKGSMEGALPMMGLLILAAALGFQTFPIADAFATIFGQTTEDYSNVVETRSYGEFYFYNYIPLAAEYSVNDAAYELGKDAGNFEWESSNLGGTTPTYTSLYTEWIDNTSEQLNSRITGAEGGCSIPDTDLEMTIFGTTDIKDTKFKISGDEASIEVTCPTLGTRYFSADKYGVIDRAVNNRYNDISYDVSGFYNDLKQELNQNTKNEYSDYKRSDCECENDCTSEPYERQAEATVYTNYRNDVEQAISNVVSNYPTVPGFIIVNHPSNEFWVDDQNWKYGGIRNVERESQRTTGGKPDCGDCGEDGDKDEYYCWGRSKATPEKVNVPLKMKDASQKIIVDKKYRNLLFNVTEGQVYNHFFDY
jgi:hypothetical protein